ncbi:rhodanese-like domain-containing protein [Puniceicoccales bacterium CK1056]|uniref:Rhodanese-like domain-containing protein n=1 Tax=Oceanipulchritudo coccoides TaxID=2706888 RepID=A0A6B2M3K8_9BACT|nr:rhodanese-like domain-containing protein [Oceanipulchritudo coccoides]
MKFVIQVSLLLLGAGLLAGVHGLIVGSSGSSHALAKHGLEVDEAIGLGSALWVDARSPEAFAIGHYPGAYNINMDNWMEGVGLLLEAWDPGESIIVYCDGSSCSASRELAYRIRSELGLEPAYWLRGGWEALESEKGVLE